MDCLAYCFAESYRQKPLLEAMRHRYKSTLLRDVVHIELPEGQREGEIGHVFCFPYGATVFWGIDKDLALSLLEELKKYGDQRPEDLETDEFIYTYGLSAKIIEDEITLPDSDLLTKLAVSHGIAQSVKLGNFETKIQKTFNSNKHLPEDLARKGKILLSRYDIRRKMGELFIERSSINLHFDVLDTPEFFWEYPELDPLYRMVSNYLDISTRVDVLNKRLDVIHELFEMLGNELNHQHSSRLEWTIIYLIVIEVVLTVAKDLLKWL